MSSRSKRPMPKQLVRDWRSLALGQRIWVLLKMLVWGWMNGRDQKEWVSNPVASGWAWG